MIIRVAAVIVMCLGRRSHLCHSLAEFATELLIMYVKNLMQC